MYGAFGFCLQNAEIVARVHAILCFMIRLEQRVKDEQSIQYIHIVQRNFIPESIKNNELN